ncbi:MAG: excinuclease ABC subunit UvrC [Ureaplasma sp.]|nr:excinuclease ABC subunit UvrC [Ureaplasma sp.]
MNENLKQKLKTVPKQPGCYLWKNKYGEIIYVGKAKNLFNRVHQYFSNINDPKKFSLVNEIEDLEYITVNNENESLILEKNLIHQHWPKYNILLKDQSDYPYIVITQETNPRILYTRKINKEKGTFYGPLADNNFHKFKLYKLLNETVPFRKCNKLPKQKCIYYDIGQCLGPCIKPINQEIYSKWKKYVADLFRNKNSEIYEIIKRKELNASQLLNFEEAQKYKEIYDGLKNLQIMQVMEVANNANNDYVAYYYSQNWIVINIFVYKDDKFFSKTTSIHFVFDDYEETLVEYLNNYYDLNTKPNKVIVSLSEDNLKMLNYVHNNVFELPTKKVEQEIIKTALVNAKTYLQNHLLSHEYKTNIINSGLEELRKVTGLNKLSHIEIFDNSNLNLTNSVSGMIVYLNGVFNKKLSRHYKLKTIDNASDYEYMKEVIYRRYSKHPDGVDLIILDGGKIQVKAALESLSKLNLNIPVIGLKKNDNHKTESIILSNYDEIKLDKNGILYILLSKMQDDVHNFAINFFREQKISNDFNSLLDGVPGLGQKRIKKLYSIYKDLDEIKKLSLEELSQVIPKSVAEELIKVLKSN